MRGSAVRCGALVVLLAACGPVVAAEGETSTGDPPTVDTSTIDDEDDDGDEAPESESSGVAESTTVSIEESSGADPTAGFIQDPDGGGEAIECDVWEQDCPDGQKCMPWANDGGSSWNATKCVPLARMPGDLGDPCTVEDSGASGIDDCKLGAMCWDVDPLTNMGECVGLCRGSEANPTCEDPNASCIITSEGVLNVCLRHCEPLLQDCDDGDACYPIDDGFGCVPDASGDTGAYGDACRFLHTCDPGLFCATQESVPGCGGSGCCTSFCDASDLGASAECPGFADGQECIAWYEDGQAPPGYENVGACMIPA